MLVLTHRETPLPDTLGETGRVMHEWVVVVDSDESLPLTVSALGGLDEFQQPYPAYGVFVRHEYQFALNGTRQPRVPAPAGQLRRA